MCVEAIKTAARMSWAAWRGAAKGKRRARGEIRREVPLRLERRNMRWVAPRVQGVLPLPFDAVAKVRRMIVPFFLLAD